MSGSGADLYVSCAHDYLADLHLLRDYVSKFPTWSPRSKVLVPFSSRETFTLTYRETRIHRLHTIIYSSRCHQLVIVLEG